MKLKPGNPMQSVLQTVLIFEVIVYGLSIFVIYQNSGRPVWQAVLLGGGVAFLALISAVLLRKGTVGYVLGWLTQVASVAVAIASPPVTAMVVVFGGLWVLGIVLGRRLEARAAAGGEDLPAKTPD